ncbi:MULTISPECIES: flagellar basal body L-ring protein FlgH [Bradyrhizobium]|uniref:Flagellar L-ring protein n=1 Tax=Bradyrhizobium symbiodeficiens TaxID=1404367 RepID=A0A2U8QEM6_9BRAD|nr:MULTISPECIES: flagellar basal body L-ring protein FlgH [Bradyrhizobium]AWM08573.1 flagellar basal body L-ring protein FlgH [Bradyrhizobium symbiodeficiens]QDF39140.1 flagellar basal body L-ring protein FlgH [Bradyrhizobium symbiodeficiens]QIP01584.1 flagellar basal body L-ring protein FlgH [Bradyrhizobium symbiodeficiens]QIP08773.1 flagellar basal body L-ring protein FlgH [Bradyrhizobium symbiodeficiens]UPJ56458.1 flagellar basal body L-ring protein FlgH [Bradyrhizobium sp. 192]
MSAFSSAYRLRRIAISALLLASCALGGCSSIDRLSQIGEQPKLSAIDNPTTQPGYKPVQMPMPKPEVASYNPNSLWRNGSRAFFKDQRARQVGDLLTVTVNITDKANIANETQRSRTAKEDSGITDFIGSQTVTQPLKVLPGRLLTTDSTSSSDGKGSVNRTEALQTNVAAVVTQVLPNGNLVVEGKQEIRVNYEIRELVVAGIVRPEDIQSDNTIDSSKIAQARIAYGGRGQITDVQQPRYGQQVMDVLLPF